MRRFYDANKSIILPAAIFFIVVIAFGRMAFNGFAYDDILLELNQNIKSVINPVYYFTHPGALITTIPESKIDIYRPLGAWLFAVQYRLFGLNPFYFHLINLLLHAANGILLFFLLKKILKSDALSFAGALIFAIHPAATEAVAWIWQQPGLWSWMFSLIVLNLAFIDEANDGLFLTKKRKKIALLATFSFAAVFFKDHAIVLPFLYILCLLIRKERVKNKIAEIAAVLSPAIIFFAVRNALLTPLYQFNRLDLWGGKIYFVFLTMLKGMVYYFKLLIWPHPLLLEYGPKIPIQKTFMNAGAIASFVFLSLLVLLAIFSWRKRPIFSAGIFWIFIVLLPVSNLIVARDTIINERFLYFIIPGFILSVFDLFILIETKFQKTIKTIMPLLILIITLKLMFFSYLVYARLGDWKNNLTLWRHEIQNRPTTWRAMINYGISLERNNESQKAVEHYKTILQNGDLSYENFVSSSEALAFAYVRLKETQRAETLLLSARQKAPDNYQLTAALGYAYLAKKDYAKASEIFKKTMAKDNKNRNDTMAFFTALASHLNDGKIEQTKKEIEKINNPALREITFPLIDSRKKILENKCDEALLVLRTILATNASPLTEPYFWLSECFEKNNDKKRAFEAYQIGFAIDPNSIDAAQGIIRNSDGTR